MSRSELNLHHRYLVGSVLSGYRYFTILHGGIHYRDQHHSSILNSYIFWDITTGGVYCFAQNRKTWHISIELVAYLPGVMQLNLYADVVVLFGQNIVLFDPIRGEALAFDLDVAQLVIAR